MICNLDASTIKDWAVAGASITGAVVAVLGLTTWKRQLKGNIEYEVARKILKGVYGLREGIAVVRNPWMQYSPEPNLPKEEKEGMSREQKEWLAYMQAYNERFKAINEPRAEIWTNLLEGQVLWGPEIKRLMGPIFSQISLLHLYIEWAIEEKKPGATPHDFSREERSKHREAMFAMGDDSKDEFYQTLQGHIEKVEAYLRPMIGRK